MKRKLAAIGMAFCLMTGTVSAMGIEAAAAEAATVTGTVRSGTTSDLLLLSTKEGNMEIKLDSGTDTSGCKFLLPGSQISVTVTHGSDEYLHATKLSGSTTVTGVTVDTSNVSSFRQCQRKDKGWTAGAQDGAGGNGDQAGYFNRYEWMQSTGGRQDLQRSSCQRH